MADHDGRGYSARHTTILTIPRLGLLGGLSIERRAKEPGSLSRPSAGTSAVGGSWRVSGVSRKPYMVTRGVVCHAGSPEGHRATVCGAGKRRAPR